jgi:hypothetical protein
MFWVILLSALGLAVAFVIFLTVWGYLAMSRKCPAEQFACAVRVTVTSPIPAPRSVEMTDPDQIGKLVSYLSDEARPSVKASAPTVLLVFTMPDRRVHQIEASPMGWNWRYDPRLGRRLTDEYAFMHLVNELLPPVSAADLDTIAIPEEDLSWFDESRVPEDLRDLVPLAKAWGRGDDLLRGEIVGRASPEERHDLIARVLPRARRIQEYIESFGIPTLESPLPDECARFMYMGEAAEEAQRHDGTR